MTGSSEADPAGDMRDAQLVELARAGDRVAFEAIFIRYADQVHDLCWSVLREAADAADATRATFTAAAGGFEALRSPDSLRPWLFAIAGREAMRRGRGRDVSRRAGAATAASLDGATEIVWAGAGDLTARDCVLLDLDIRRGLDRQELADALGAGADRAFLHAARLRAKVERALSALLVAGLGRDNCPELDALLSGWDGRLDRLVRTRVAHHVEGCHACNSRRIALPSPLALLAAIPLVPAPGRLRAEVLDQVRTLGQVGSRRGLRRGNGFPPPLDRPAHRRPPLIGAAAVVAIVALVVGVLAIGSDDGDVTLAGDGGAESDELEGRGDNASDEDRDDGDRPSDDDDDAEDDDVNEGDGRTDGGTGVPPEGDAPDADAGDATTVPDVSGNPAPDVPSTGSPAGSGRSGLSGTGGGTVSPGGPDTNTAPDDARAPSVPADLTLSTAAVDLGGASNSAVVTIGNAGTATTNWSAGPGTTWLSASPSSGSLAPGMTADVVLSADRVAAPEGDDIGVGVTIWAGGDPVGTITVTADIARPPTITNVVAVDERLVVEGCAVEATQVTADVVDESGLVVLNDVQPVVVEVTGPDGMTFSVAMTPVGGDTWAAPLGPFGSAGTASWTVVATDPHSNEARSATQTIPVDACPRPG